METSYITLVWQQVKWHWLQATEPILVSSLSVFSEYAAFSSAISALYSLPFFWWGKIEFKILTDYPTEYAKNWQK